MLVRACRALARPLVTPLAAVATECLYTSSHAMQLTHSHDVPSAFRVPTRGNDEELLLSYVRVAEGGVRAFAKQLRPRDAERLVSLLDGLAAAPGIVIPPQEVLYDVIRAVLVQHDFAAAEESGALYRLAVRLARASRTIATRSKGANGARPRRTDSGPDTTQDKAQSLLLGAVTDALCRSMQAGSSGSSTSGSSSTASWPMAAVCDVVQALAQAHALNPQLVQAATARVTHASQQLSEAAVYELATAVGSSSWAAAATARAGGKGEGGGAAAAAAALLRALEPHAAAALAKAAAAASEEVGASGSGSSGSRGASSLSLPQLDALASTYCKYSVVAPDLFDALGDVCAVRVERRLAAAPHNGASSTSSSSTSTTTASGQASAATVEFTARMLSIARSMVFQHAYHHRFFVMLGALWSTAKPSAASASALPPPAAANALAVDSALRYASGVPHLCLESTPLRAVREQRADASTGAATAGTAAADAAAAVPPQWRLIAPAADSSSGTWWSALPPPPAPLSLAGPFVEALIAAAAGLDAQTMPAPTSGSGSSSSRRLGPPEVRYRTPEGVTFDVAFPAVKLGVRLLRARDVDVTRSAGAAALAPGPGTTAATAAVSRPSAQLSALPPPSLAFQLEQAVSAAAGWRLVALVDEDVLPPPSRLDDARDALLARARRILSRALEEVPRTTA